MNNCTLLVEDNPDDELLAMHALQASGVANKLVIARDGVEALDYLLARGPHQGRDVNELPALVLLDLNMPRLGGFDVLRAMRQHPVVKHVPVVILTTSKYEQDLVAGYELGANSYVRKPLDFEEFAEAIRQVGKYWLLLNERPRA